MSETFTTADVTRTIGPVRYRVRGPLVSYDEQEGRLVFEWRTYMGRQS